MKRKPFNPQRLTWIRKKRGLNKTNLAHEISVDPRSISAFESGEYPPSTESIAHLSKALGVLEGFFFMGEFGGPEPEQASFRSLSKLTAAKRDIALGSGAIAFSFNLWLESQFNFPKPQLPNLGAESPEQAAMTLRSLWSLGEQPVSNIVHLLESKGVRVFSLAIDIDEVDAFCTWRDDTPFVFLNTKKSNARRRFDAAHELGHLVLHRHGDYEGRATEKEANEFASAFLMPRDGLSATASRLPNLNNLISSKSKWGVSVAAYVVRLYQLGLVTDWHYRMLFKQIGQRGYRKSEPCDHHVEKSQLLEKVFLELKRDGIGIRQIANFIGVSIQDIQELCFDLVLLELDGGRSTTQSRKGHLSIVVDNTKH